MDISKIEKELKKRLTLPYNWGVKQSNLYDEATNFIYHIDSFEPLIEKIEKQFKGKPKYETLKNYALNRWFNFWSAQAIEQIFCSFPGVVPDKDKTNLLVDFTIQGVQFDHKTSVFPKGFGKTLEDAKNNPQILIKWLYLNQSQQGRKHMKNRLFLVLYSTTEEHWKLKAEINWLKTIIENYMASFDVNNLQRFTFERTGTTLSDIIWAIK